MKEVHFRLIDGRAQFATHKFGDEYFFEGDEIPDGAEEVEKPSQEILDRAEQLAGKTFSKSEFEKLLYEKTELEKLMESHLDLWDLILFGGEES